MTALAGPWLLVVLAVIALAAVTAGATADATWARLSVAYHTPPTGRHRR